jgi:hypothetical protein
MKLPGLWEPHVSKLLETAAATKDATSDLVESWPRQECPCALLGHTQPATTARYAHLLDDPLRKPRARGRATGAEGEGGQRANFPATVPK